MFPAVLECREKEGNANASEDANDGLGYVCNHESVSWSSCFGGGRFELRWLRTWRIAHNVHDTPSTKPTTRGFSRESGMSTSGH